MRTNVILFTKGTVDYLLQTFDFDYILMVLYMVAHGDHYFHTRYWIAPCAFDVICENLYLTKMCHKMGYVVTANIAFTTECSTF